MVLCFKGIIKSKIALETLSKKGLNDRVKILQKFHSFIQTKEFHDFKEEVVRILKDVKKVEKLVPESLSEAETFKKCI